MRERMRYHAPAHLRLDGVIADGVGGAHRFLDVTALEVLFGMVRPNTRIVIGLQFEPDRVFVVIRAAAPGADFIRDSQKLLDMMTDLVRDDIGLSKVTG